MKRAHSQLSFAVAALACLLQPGFAEESKSAGAPVAVSAPVGETVRTWTDRTGKKTAQATLVEVIGDTLRLRRPSGKIARVSLDELGASDQRYVEQFLKSKSTSKDKHAEAAEAGQAIKKWWESVGLPKPDEVVDGLRKLPSQLAGGADDPDSVLPSNLVYVRVSKDFLRKQVARAVERDNPVSDSILGTSIMGLAHTSGWIDLELLPDRDRAVADIVFSGTIWSATQGYNGPVMMDNSAQTQFQAVKRLVFAPTGVQSLPAIAQASGASATNNIQSSLPGLRGSIARRVANRQIYERRPQADAIASEHAAARIQQSLDSEIDSVIARLHGRFNMTLQRRPYARDTIPPKIHLDSTSRYVQLVLYRSRASSDERKLFPPRMEGNPAVVARVHRSVVGRYLTDPTLRKALAPVVAGVIGKQSQQHGGAEIKRVAANAGVNIHWSDDRSWLMVEYDPVPQRAAPPLPMVAW